MQTMLNFISPYNLPHFVQGNTLLVRLNCQTYKVENIDQLKTLLNNIKACN